MSAKSSFIKKANSPHFKKSFVISKGLVRVECLIMIIIMRFSFVNLGALFCCWINYIKYSKSFSVMLHLTYIVIISLFYFFGKVRSNFVVLISWSWFLVYSKLQQHSRQTTYPSLISKKVTGVTSGNVCITL